MYNSAKLIIAEDTPGLLTPGQTFSGTLTRSDWEALEQAKVAIVHNSWFTADLPALFTGSGVTQVLKESCLIMMLLTKELEDS